jgi:hypothetical protein
LGIQANRSAVDFYAAGGGITALQNGLALAGAYISAASFVGISGLVYLAGFGGLIYSVGSVVGWPMVAILLVEPLCNLGRFTVADAVPFRLSQTPIRVLSACATLSTVIFYLISQMVGGGALIGLLFGLDYRTSVAIVGDTGDSLYCPRRHVGHDLDSDHQSVPAARRDERSGLHGHDGVQIQSGGPIRQLGRSSSAAFLDHVAGRPLD